MASENGRALAGLALGGGGARGLAHLGVLKVLEREEFPVDLLAGSSIGGVVGACYALYGSVAAIEAELQSGLKAATSRYSFNTRLEMLDSRPYRRWLRHVFGRLTFADLRIPLAVTAVDIDSGEELILGRGLVAPAVSATSAIPGIYEPIEANGRRLVDGGLLNPVPVDVARRMGAEIVIAVDVLTEIDRPALRLPASPHRAALSMWPALSDMIGKSFDVAIARLRDYRLSVSPPDLLITPDLRGVSTVDYHRAYEVLARGEEAAETHIDSIRRLRDSLLAYSHAASVPVPAAR